MIPGHARRRAPSAPIRVWSAGCASGEEAYTSRCCSRRRSAASRSRERVKIYATDVDEEALTSARRRPTRERDSRRCRPELLRQVLRRARATASSFDKDLRRAVIFGRHDLDSGRADLADRPAVCRNTLMYFNAETQSRILARFHFALTDDGFCSSARRRCCSRTRLCSCRSTCSAGSSARSPRRRAARARSPVVPARPGRGPTPTWPSTRLYGVAFDAEPVRADHRRRGGRAGDVQRARARACSAWRRAISAGRSRTRVVVPAGGAARR